MCVTEKSHILTKSHIKSHGVYGVNKVRETTQKTGKLATKALRKTITGTLAITLDDPGRQLDMARGYTGRH